MKSVMQDTEASWKKTHLLSLYPKIFDYRLGGYYHQERWARTRQYYQLIYYLMSKGRTIYLSLYSKHVFDYSPGATPIGSAGRAPDEIFTCIKRVKKAKEDLDSAITPIRREFILVKVGQPEDF
jgi:hypothetical protein